MSERILVRGELSNWVHAGRVAGGVAAAAGLLIGLVGAKWGWFLAAGGAALWLCLECLAWQKRRVQTWLTLHPDGIEVEGPGGHRAIHDSQVSAVSLQTIKNFANGDYSSTTRKFSIWAEDWPEPILMENRIKLGLVDPLAGLIERLLVRLERKMAGDLAHGGTASGDNWHLSRSALTVGKAPLEEQLPLSEVVAIEEREGQMCVWRRGADLAAAKLPLSGRNVYLLPALVRPFQTESVESRVGLNVGSSLGRVLFERRTSRSTVVVLAILGIGLAAVALTLLVAFASKGDEGALVSGSIMFVAGCGVAFSALWLGAAAFRCHEHGVWKKTVLGQTSLKYDDVGRFSYSAIRHYHNGAYIGTQVTMRFVPLPSVAAKPMKYTARIKGEDEDLDELRDAVSRRIAVGLINRIQAKEVVAWTQNLEFTQEGIRYRSQKWFLRQPPQLLAYEDYGGYEFKGAVLYLFARGNKKYVVSEQATAENFYPGLLVLQMLLHRPVTADAAAAT